MPYLRDRGRRPFARAVTAALILAVGLSGAITAIPASAESAPDDVPFVADPTLYVDPMIGTGNGGESVGEVNNFPGVAAPLGMMQFSPDTPGSPAGYAYDATTIKGFSLNHASVGCPAFGDIPILPITGAIPANPGNRTERFNHTDESATLGSYQVRLTDSNVNVGLTATTRTGLAQFTYPAGSSAQVLVKAGSSIGGSRDAEVQVLGNREVAGSSKTGGFCGVNNNDYTVYFSIVFDRPFTAYGTWRGSSVTPGSATSSGANSGAYLSFDTSGTQVVTAKVSMSYVSVAGARANMAAEIPGWDLAPVAADTRAKWKSILNKIQVGGGTEGELKTFYTALYHSFLHPNTFNDVDGRYIGFDDKIHQLPAGQVQYANFSDWDIYRSLAPLHAMLMPAETGQMGNSLLRAAQEQGGWWPRWPLANDTTSQMNGDNSVPLFGNYSAFGATGLDIANALPIMIKGATQSAPIGWGWWERRGVEDYVRLGYQPNNEDSRGDHGLQGASQTLEWAIDDYAISRLAEKIGRTDVAVEYARRAQNWQNIFNPTTGYLQPRDDNGAFPNGPAFVTPAAGTFGQTGYAEGNSAQYNWLVPQNMAGLIAAMGGKDYTANRLDTFFTQINNGPNVPYMWAGNEVNFGVPWIYNYLDRPWKTQAAVRRLQTQLFSATPGGSPGNDDLGAQSSWYVWAALGMYPVTPGSPDLSVNSPLFKRAVMHLGNGKDIEVNAPEAATDAPYVTGLTLNGQNHESTALPQSIVTDGGRLDFSLSTQPNTSWATAPTAAPPSYQDHQKPAVGLTNPTGPVNVTAGTSLDVTIGAQGTGLGTTPVTWKAGKLPAGITVTPSTGTLTAPSIGAATTQVKVTVDAGITSGYYPVPFEFSTAGGTALPGGALVLTALADDNTAITCNTLATVEAAGLRWVDNGDGHTTVVTVGGQTGRTTTAGSGYMYFDIDNLLVPGGTYDAVINVTYFDQGTGTWNIQYDSRTPNQAYQGSPNFRNTNTNTWKTATFTLANVRFESRQNAGADFRINIGAGGQTIGRVSVATKGTGVKAMHLCSGLPVAPTVSAQPVDVLIPATGTATFTATAKSDPAATVRWQSQLGTGGWVDVPGATATTLTVATPSVDTDGTRYRAVFSNLVGSVTSDPATLRVFGPPAVSVVGGKLVEGGTIMFTGNGFLPGEEVVVTSAPEGTRLGTVTADGNHGGAAGSFPLPAGVLAGNHQLVLTGSVSAGSATAAFTVLATPAPATSTTALTLSVPSVTSGKPVTATVRVTASSGTAGGYVAVLDGQTPVGVGALVSGTAQIALTLPAGTHQLTARFVGDASVAGSVSSGVPFSVTFADYAGGTFFTEVMWLAGSGITSGQTPTTFAPALPVTRQAMAAFLYRLEHPGAPPAECVTAPFTDVPVTNTFCGEISWLAEARITTGQDGTFKPGASVERQAMAAFLYRATHAGATAPACTTKPFADVAVNNPFCGEIRWLAEQGITVIAGGAAGRFAPTGAVTREAMAAFLFRLSHPAVG
ncbi:hypothetical protein D1871_15865 [Nakamurella silvestris]|nr:hypothetical protein D1871_15865 [Nakamurella silvestris]